MKHLIYSRKSSESEERQVLSIPAQLRTLNDIAEREAYEIGASYEESMSAKASGRPIFNEMIKIIQKSKGCSLLVWNIDRLARNMIDGGMLLELMDQGKIIEIRTFEKTYRNTPDDKFMMALGFGMAKKYVDDLSVNVKRGLDEKMKRGEWPNKAPFGYLNDNPTKSIVIDPERSRYVRRTYELYLSGSHSFASIADKLHEEGLRTSTGKKVLKSYVQRILTTRFYTGVMERNGKLYEGKYEPLITKDDFDNAQAIMSGTARPRAKNNALLFPLRGFMTCESCGCTITASLKKGHQYYYCTNGKGVCDSHKKYVREDDLNKEVAELFKPLRFSERKIELMYQAAQIEAVKRGGSAGQIIESLEQRLNALPARESRLLDAFVGEQITQELYDQKALVLKHERIDLTKQLEKAKSSQPVFTLEPTKEVFLQGSRATSEFLEADDLKKRTILEKLLGNLSIKDGKVEQIQFKSPYHVLANAPKNGSNLMLLRD
jgi:site-specific DNA recombinase